MKRPQHDIDAEALEAVYETARAKISKTHVMDDNAKGRLIVLVLRSYYSGLNEDGFTNIHLVATEVAAEFKGD